MKRISFRVKYDGTGYHGWQSQPNLDPTIQGTIEKVLKDFFKRDIRIQGASRTDAGVHALDQVMAFDLDHPISLDGLTKVLNKRLPSEIQVFDPRIVVDDFNPRFGGNGKYYVYRIYPSKQSHPILERFVWQISHPLDFEKMAQAGEILMGVHHFKSFAASNAEYVSYEREIFHFSCRKIQLFGEDIWEIRFGGSGFMKQMVRNLIGTLIEVARGHWPVEKVKEILDAQDRSKAGPTAPAKGLMLEKNLLA